jgi:hypothetical protein
MILCPDISLSFPLKRSNSYYASICTRRKTHCHLLLHLHDPCHEFPFFPAAPKDARVMALYPAGAARGRRYQPSSVGSPILSVRFLKVLHILLQVAV